MHLSIYNFTQVSPHDISLALKRLSVHHFLLRKDTRLRMHRVRKSNSGPLPEQPLNVIVTSSLDVIAKLVPKKPTIVFSTLPPSLCSVISGTIESFDISIYELDNALRWALYDALEPPETRPTIIEKSPSDHIEEVSPPSFLDKYHTAQCKINPYALRLEAQQVTIRYLANNTTRQATKQFFDTSLKFADLAEIVLSESGRNLQKAVSKVQAGGNLEDVASEFNCDTFEISYVLQSFAKFEKATP